MDDDFDRDESCCQTNRRVTGAQDTPEWVGDGEMARRSRQGSSNREYQLCLARVIV